MDTPARARPDACPGVFAPHDAADGAVARVRLPGGVVTSGALRVLADCAEELGDGRAHLTSRGNLQFRGLDRTDPRLSEWLSNAGLLPSPSHERVRNILASPLSGYLGGLADVRPLAAGLDAAVCASPELAGLPGRFLFALDDGRGDVAGEGADVCWRALDADTGAVLLAGEDSGMRVAFEGAVEALVEVARAFMAARDTEWRVRELSGFAPPVGVSADPVELPVSSGMPVGRLGPGLFGVTPAFGVLTSARLRMFAEIAPRAVVTPWRSVLLPEVRDSSGLDGLLTDTGISACIGRPGCAKSRADVRADARSVLGSGVRAHFSGCERRCGKPVGDHVDVLAEDGGYRVDGTWVPVEALSDSVKRSGSVRGDSALSDSARAGSARRDNA